MRSWTTSSASYLEATGTKASTVRTYRAALHKWFLPTLKARSLDRITASDIENAMRKMRAAGLSDKSIRVHRFVTDDLESAVAQAKETAGDKVVAVSGAGVGQRLLRAGLLDEISVHIVPVLFGGGARLFDQIGDAHIPLEPLEVIDTPNAVHMRFRVQTS